MYWKWRSLLQDKLSWFATFLMTLYIHIVTTFSVQGVLTCLFYIYKESV
jgi:hypothetical protein